jgi:release factor glutamine methyltransferase
VEGGADRVMVPLAQALRETGDRLAAAGIDGARREARLLLAHALGVQPARLLGDRNAAVAADALDALVARRAAREPLALITGRWEFWSLDLAVSPATLIPRADSETLIEAALTAFQDRDAPRRILDLGTGTGCLLLAALHEFPSAFGIGVDLVPAAARLAGRNAAALGLAGRAAFLCADWAAPLAARFDLVLCNPPYIPAADIAGLMPEVALHEPASALSGGADGLDAYRALIPRLADLLAPGGAAILELGAGQAASVSRLAAAHGLATSLRADLAGIDRALTLRQP